MIPIMSVEMASMKIQSVIEENDPCLDTCLTNGEIWDLCLFGLE